MTKSKSRLNTVLIKKQLRKLWSRCIIGNTERGLLPMSRKRIALSIRPEYHDKLVKLAEYQNSTITTVVGELLNECESAVDLMLKAFAEIEKGVDKQKVLENLINDGLVSVNKKTTQK